MNLLDMLNQPQNGQGVEALARQFGLSQQQTQSAVEALLPAFSKGLQQTATTPQGLGSLLTMLAGGQGLQGTDAGNGVLGQLFGSKDLSRAVAAQASQATGVGENVLKQMLPAIATMLMSGMAKQTNQQVAAGTFGASNPLGEIIEQMMRQGQAGGQTPQPAPQSNNPLGDILGQILGGGKAQPQSRQSAPTGSGNPLGDILGQILGGGQQGRAPQAPSGQGGNNPLGDILEQVLRGGQAQQRVPEEEDAPVSPQRRQAPKRQTAPSTAPTGSGNPLEDMLGKMFNPGGQAQPDQQYQKSIDNIFEQFRRGVESHRPR